MPLGLTMAAVLIQEEEEQEEELRMASGEKAYPVVQEGTDEEGERKKMDVPWFFSHLPLAFI